MSQLTSAEQQAEERWLRGRAGHCSLCQQQCNNSPASYTHHVASPLHFAHLVHQPFMMGLREYGHCGLCDVDRVQRASAHQHIDGKQHSSRLRGLSDQEVRRLERQSLAILHKEELEALIEPEGLQQCATRRWFNGGEWCQLCDAQCNLGIMDAHLNGRNHFIAWREWIKRMYEDDDSRVNQVDVLNEIEDQERPLPARHSLPPSPDRAGQPPPRPNSAAPRPPPSSSFSPPPPSPARAAVLPSSPQPPRLSVIVGDLCTLCQTRIGRPGDGDPTQAVIDKHVRGVRHRMRVQLVDSKWQGEQSIKSLNAKAQLAGVKAFIVCDGREINAASTSRELTLEVGRAHTIALHITLTVSTFINSILTVPALPLPTFTWKTFTRRRMDANAWKIPITVTPTVDHVGAYRTLIAVLCGGGAVAVLPLDVIVLPTDSASTAALLQPTSQYIPQPKRPLTDVNHSAEIIDGEQLSSAQKAKDLYTRPLNHFDLPPHIITGTRDVKRLTKFLHTTPLHPSSYSQRWHFLLHLEEYQMMVDIQQYDMTATLTSSRDFLRLEVMGLAEARPSVLLGDRILVSKTPFDQQVHGRSVINAGYVHQVEENAVLLKFDRGFHANWMRGQQFHVRFTFNRLPLRRCHQVLTTITLPTAQRFFPSIAPTQSLVHSSVLPHLPPSLSAPDSYLSAYPIAVISSVFDCNFWLISHVFAPRVTVVGLDTEFNEISSSEVQMELIQIATDRAVMLFDLREIGDSSDLPSELKRLLESRDIIKYVVGDRDNAHLLSVYDTAITNQVDVQKRVQNKLKLQYKPGLEKLVHGVLPDIPYVKNKVLQRSRIEWPLSKEMRDYAASDAVLALLVGKKLESMSVEQLRDGWSAAEMMVRSSDVVSYCPVDSGSLSGRVTGQEEEKAAGTSVSVRFINSHLNQPQQDAVRGVVDGHHHPFPYIIFGPPGTGKTTVLIECIQQLLRLGKKDGQNIRILATAPSNSAADLLCERLALSMDPLTMYRMNAASRSVTTLSPSVLKFSSISDGHFIFRNKGELLRYSIVIATCITAAVLYGVGMECGDFSHIIIDEAGHATEPEVLSTMTGLMDHQRTRIILGGDHQQLGPIIRSPIATAHGLHISLLERLLSDYRTNTSSPYYHSASSSSQSSHRYMTKLLYNYRSHPAILQIPNQLFYEGELIASADKMSRESLMRWDGFPTPSFPILIHHVVGKEQREGNSPSWYNIIEAQALVDHLIKLFQYKAGALRAEDVGIITPYSKQKSKIKQLLKAKFPQLVEGSIKTGSVEEFQGQERRVILISTVRSSLMEYQSFDVKFNLGFVRQKKRLNVALTRAKCAVVIVGNCHVLHTDENWRKYIEYVHQHGAVIGPYQPLAGGGDGVRAAEEKKEMDGVDPSLQSLLSHLMRDDSGVGKEELKEEDDEEKATVINAEAVWKSEE